MLSTGAIAFAYQDYSSISNIITYEGIKNDTSLLPEDRLWCVELWGDRRFCNYAINWQVRNAFRGNGYFHKYLNFKSHRVVWFDWRDTLKRTVASLWHKACSHCAAVPWMTQIDCNPIDRDTVSSGSVYNFFLAHKNLTYSSGDN
jgi:hypothetical protein